MKTLPHYPHRRKYYPKFTFKKLIISIFFIQLVILSFSNCIHTVSKNMAYYELNQYMETTAIQSEELYYDSNDFAS